MKLQKVESVKASLPVIRHVNQRIAAIRGTYLRELQLKLWPDCPDDRRGAPNAMIRSAVFGVVRRGRRQRVVKMPVSAPGGWEVTLTGWRLDQHDCDIWLEVMHLARNSPPGDYVRFTIHGMLRRLGRTAEGKANYTWLKQRLENLAETTIAFDNGNEFGVMGALISSFRIDRSTGEGVIRTNPEIRPLFESVTHLDIDQRRALGQNQLAKSLHAALASHAEWMPMRIGTLMHRVGADYSSERFFKRDLKHILDDFAARGWIRGYKFACGSGDDLLEINKVPTPAQLRSLDRRKSL